MQKIFFLLCFISTLNFASVARESHEIPNVPYFDMIGGFCTPTTIKMNLKFYDVDIPASVIQNLGWDYGFELQRASGHVMAYPTTDPVDQITHAARSFGFDYELLKHKNISEARTRLKNQINKNIPVIVQWIPHTLLAYGYENDGQRILLQDPKDLSNPFPGGPIGQVQATLSSIHSWTQPPMLWQLRQHLLIVLHPTAHVVKDWRQLDWKKIWKRNAERTLGSQRGNALYGVAAIKELGERFSEWYVEDPSAFSMTFYFAETSRRDAADFLETWEEPLLKKAAKEFRWITARYGKIHHAISRRGTDESDLTKFVSQQLKEIAARENQAGQLLMEASK